MGGLKGTVRFNISGNGAWADVTPGMGMECVCCDARFKALEIAVEFMEHDVCPDCIISGPKEMAKRIHERITKTRKGKEWTVPLLTRIAKRLEKAESILDIEGGIFALKISEAYRDIQGTPKRRTRKAA